nr:ISL3 family transposase [Salinispora pacifica]
MAASWCCPRGSRRFPVSVGDRVAAGRDTLLRLVKALPEPPKTPITVLGVDDFAFRRGRHYGTVLIDMDSHRPVGMFDGRDGDSLAEWLRQHPRDRGDCRDRAGGYGEGARCAAPQAVQVADRFHLWQNLGQAVEKTINAYRSLLVSAAPPPEDDTMPAEVQPLPEKKIVTRLREHHTAVHQLAAQGLNKSAIGRKLGLHQATVRKYLNAVSVAELAMTGRHGDRLEMWITTVEVDTLTPLAGFARHLRRDFDAVRNRLTLPHSSGAVEGNINRLKMIKRQMFGRAGLDLLRKRVVLAH